MKTNPASNATARAMEATLYRAVSRRRPPKATCPSKQQACYAEMGERPVEMEETKPHPHLVSMRSSSRIREPPGQMTEGLVGGGAGS